MKKIKAPEQTIAEFQQTAEALKEAVSPVPLGTAPAGRRRRRPCPALGTGGTAPVRPRIEPLTPGRSVRRVSP